jgi:hypothetical protein
VILIPELKLEAPLPPRTGSTWIRQAFGRLGYRTEVTPGRKHVVEPHRYGEFKRLTTRRQTTPWLRSIYHTLYRTGEHLGIPALKYLLALKVSTEEDFVQYGRQFVTGVWAYYIPAHYICHTESLAEDFIMVLKDLGQKLPEDKIRSWRPVYSRDQFCKDAKARGKL